MMNVKFLNPFVEAAFEVLEAEVSTAVERGNLCLERSACTSNELTVLISVLGELQGVVLYSMSEATALAIVSNILGQPFEELDDLAQSGIGELGNVITGHAAKRMSDVGLDARISTPTLVLGKGVLISTLDFQRLVVPLETGLGQIQIHLALREMPSDSQPVPAEPHAPGRSEVPEAVPHVERGEPTLQGAEPITAEVGI